MLDKNPQTRISADQCLEHPWLSTEQFNQTPPAICDSIVKKLRDFRAPKTLQKETLKFLVNNITSEIDFKTIRDAFRAIDTSNSGIITWDQIKKGYSHDSHVTHLNTEYIDQIFKRLDFNKDGTINYSEFLTATVDKKRTLTTANLQFAFHHFDTDNEGFITRHDLKEVFKR